MALSSRISRPVSADDSNDIARGDCPGHEWRIEGMHLRPDGGYLEFRCPWCDGYMVETRADFGGRPA